MNNIRINTIGIDASIQEIQKSLYKYLSQRWDGKIEGYGRVYKNKNSDGNVIPEWYNSTNRDYQNVYYDDSKSAVFCFLVSDEDLTNNEFVFTSKVKCVFAINLEKILSSKERVDLEAQRDAVQFLRDSNFNTFKITFMQNTI